MTGRLRRGKAVFRNHALYPFDRAPCGLSVMPGSPPRGCGTWQRDRLKSVVVQPKDAPAARHATSRRLSMLPLRCPSIMSAIPLLSEHERTSRRHREIDVNNPYVSTLRLFDHLAGSL